MVISSSVFVPQIHSCNLNYKLTICRGWQAGNPRSIADHDVQLQVWWGQQRGHPILAYKMQLDKWEVNHATRNVEYDWGL
jgi:hypothetical protein